MATDIQSETKQHLSDMIALQTHVLDAVEHQLGTEAITKDPDAAILLRETQAVYTRHIAQMEAMVEQQDAETRASLKSMITGFMGDLAGMYNKLRSEGAARAIRDTYTALSLTAASLTALKTFGLMVGREAVSKLAYEQMKDICPLIERFSHRLPYIVARETAANDNLPYDEAIPQRVENATRRIWRGEA